MDDTDDDLVFPHSKGGMWKTEDWKNWTSRVFQKSCVTIGVGRIVPEKVTDPKSGKLRTKKLFQNEGVRR